MSKSSAKSVFDQNKNVSDWSLFEDMNDYLFTQLQLQPGDGLVYTEPFAVTEKEREDYFELFFEGYQMDFIMPTLDSVASSFKIMNDFKTNNALVVYVTDYDITCYPFVQGKLDYKQTRKNTIGLKHSQDYFQRLLRLKYPDLENYFT